MGDDTIVDPHVSQGHGVRKIFKAETKDGIGAEDAVGSEIDDTQVAQAVCIERPPVNGQFADSEW